MGRGLARGHRAQGGTCGGGGVSGEAAELGHLEDRLPRGPELRGRCGARTPLLPRRLRGRLAAPHWASGLGARSSLTGTAAEMRGASWR